MVTAAARALGEQNPAVHRWVRRHPELVAPGCLGECPRRHPVNITLDPETLFDLVIERLQLFVGERPIGDVGVRHRPVQRAPLEVVAPEARHLRVPVNGPAADDGGQIVDIAGERPLHAQSGFGLGPARARLEDRVLIFEIAASLDLVV